MRAAVAAAYGPPQTVVLAEVPVPSVGPGDVLVRVLAAAVNFPDLLLVAGRYQVPVPVPFVPGSDLAGLVVAVGIDVTDVRPGDRVAATTATGAFAEYAAVPAESVFRVPDGVEFAAAAAFGVVYSTAYPALRWTAGLQAGERLGVLGAGGGVGLAAVEIGRLLGADVVAVATGANKLAVCREHGATVTVDLADADLRGRLKADGGLDVVIDLVGGPATEVALRSLRAGGRLITVGYASGVIPSIPLNLLLLKSAAVIGFGIGTFTRRFPERAAEARRDLLGHLAAGRIRPHIGARYPLAQTAAALQALADRAVAGKIVIDVA
jgi:NADPH2:quinone reductase